MFMLARIRSMTLWRGKGALDMHVSMLCTLRMLCMLRPVRAWHQPALWLRVVLLQPPACSAPCVRSTQQPPRALAASPAIQFTLVSKAPPVRRLAA